MMRKAYVKFYGVRVLECQQDWSEISEFCVLLVDRSGPAAAIESHSDTA